MTHRNGLMTDKLLDDAVIQETAIRGHSLLQWDFVGKFPSRSIQLPTEVAELILKWRNRYREEAQ